MIATVRVNDQYVKQFEQFVMSLPSGAVTVSHIKNSLDKELYRRITAYANGTMKTTPFHQGLDTLRAKIVAKT